MRTICFILFFIFIPFFSYAGVISDVSCPVGEPVEVSFQWKSTVNITVASNTVSVVLPETPSGVYSSFKIPAVSGASGVVKIDYSSGTLQSFSCVAVSQDKITYEQYWQLASIFIGVLTAIAFVIALSMRW